MRKTCLPESWIGAVPIGRGGGNTATLHAEQSTSVTWFVERRGIPVLVDG